MNGFIALLGTEYCFTVQRFLSLSGLLFLHYPFTANIAKYPYGTLNILAFPSLYGARVPQQPSLDMTRLLSRTPGREADKRNARDEWGKTHGSGIWLTGRTVLNMWRLMRSELKLCSYTLQVPYDAFYARHSRV